MCLTKITRKYEKPKTLLFYKVMYRLRRKGKPNLYSFQVMSQCRPIMKNEVKSASVGDIWMNRGGGRYRAGFHGYVSLVMTVRKGRLKNRDRFCKRSSEGKKYKVIVLCEGKVRTVGSQRGSQVVVADTMKILREVPLTQITKKK